MFYYDLIVIILGVRLFGTIILLLLQVHYGWGRNTKK